MFDQISKFNFAETSNTVLDAVVDTNRRVVDAVVTLADARHWLERVPVDQRLADCAADTRRGRRPLPRLRGAGRRDQP